MNNTFTIAAPRLRLAAVTLACAAAFAAQARPLYHVEAADSTGAVFSLSAINAAGVAAGMASTPGQLPQAAIVSTGSYHDADANVADTTTSTAVGINSSGTSVGMALIDGPNQVPVMWDAAGNRTLLKLPDGERTVVTGINDDGTICGYANIVGAVIWKNGKPKLIAEILNGFGATSVAFAINKKGWVTGGLPDDNGYLHPFIYKDGQTTNLGGLGVNSYGQAINGKGHIAGIANIDNMSSPRHAIWYDGTAWHDIGDLGGKQGAAANGINVHDVIVGGSSVKGQQDFEAFVYEKGHMYRIDKHLDATTAPGWQLNYAMAINDAGVIVGEGTFNGVERGFIATPVPN